MPFYKSVAAQVTVFLRKSDGKEALFAWDGYAKVAPAMVGASAVILGSGCRFWLAWAISLWERPHPTLSGGEAQWLYLAAEMGRAQDDAVFVFDEPTIGLHPLDVRVLIGVFRLIESGATVIVIEHDLDMIANADYVVDMGPGGGEAGGQIVAAGTPGEIATNSQSLTREYLKAVTQPQEVTLT